VSALIRQSRPAQSLVEFALVVPLFCLLMFSVVDVARVLFTYASIAHGARELARSASVSTGWTSASALSAFNNHTLIAGAQNPATDRLTVRVGNASCARTLDLNGTCAPAPTSTTCSLPLQVATCTLPTPTQNGFVEVQVSYTFQFNPLPNSRLDGVAAYALMRPTLVLTTTSRAYVE